VPVGGAETLRRLFRHRAFMGYAFTSTFMSRPSVVPVGLAVRFIERYGIAPRAYGLNLRRQMVVFMTLGSLLNAKFAPVFGAGKILRYAVIVPAIAGPAAMSWIYRGALRHDRHVAVPACFARRLRPSA